MFWMKTIQNQKKDINYLSYKIKLLEKQFETYGPIITDLEKRTKECENKIDALFESNETYLNRFIEISKDIEAISAVLASDRKDINALIQLVKKSTKGKK